MDNFEDAPERPDLHTIGFYNVENLFDIYDDKRTNDNDFLPISAKKWTPNRYDNKLRKLSFTIANIGRLETGKPPAVMGLAEVENAKVIEDLINYEHLKSYNYNYVHYNSPDERGIDVALIYNADMFKIDTTDTFSIYLEHADGTPDYTRDILLVSGSLHGDYIHIIVNHWSSRHEGEKETEQKRLVSSEKVAEIIDSLQTQNSEAKIIVMGDFNDNPSNQSIKNLVNNFNLYNPMDTLRSFSRGTVLHNRQWFLFDQIFFTSNFIATTTNALEYETADIFDVDFLKQFKGKFKGSPFRTYVGKKYHGGYSDHFPVYAIFKKN